MLQVIHLAQVINNIHSNMRRSNIQLFRMEVVYIQDFSNGEKSYLGITVLPEVPGYGVN